MISFIFLSFAIVGTLGHPGTLLGSHLGFVPTITTQHHSQDELGQYSYGYSGGPSAKEEIRTADGITRGSYSYIDANGLVQSASYVSDPVNGFRVAATNLPVGPAAPAVPAVPAVPVVSAVAPVAIAETPEVISAKAAHFAAHGEALARLGRKRRSVALYHPSALVTSKYHAQDELGQYNFGYASPLSSRDETRTVDGITRGSYSYVDANGIVQTAHYVADALGFRVAATNLPVGSVA